MVKKSFQNDIEEIHSITILSLKNDKKESDVIERPLGILKTKFYTTIFMVYVVGVTKHLLSIQTQTTSTYKNQFPSSIYSGISSKRRKLTAIHNWVPRPNEQ